MHIGQTVVKRVRNWKSAERISPHCRFRRLFTSMASVRHTMATAAAAPDPWYAPFARLRLGSSGHRRGPVGPGRLEYGQVAPAAVAQPGLSRQGGQAYLASIPVDFAWRERNRHRSAAFALETRNTACLREEKKKATGSHAGSVGSMTISRATPPTGIEGACAPGWPRPPTA